MKARSLIEGGPDLLRSLNVTLSEEEDTDPLALQIMAEMAYRRCDRKAFDRLVAKVKGVHGYAMPYYELERLEEQTGHLHEQPPHHGIGHRRTEYVTAPHLRDQRHDSTSAERGNRGNSPFAPAVCLDCLIWRLPIDP